MSETMSGKVLSIRFISGNKTLKAFADIEIFNWTIRDFRISKQDGQRISVEPPKATWKDPATGQVRFKPILLIPSEQKQMIDIAILSAYQKALEKNYEKEQGSQK